CARRYKWYFLIPWLVPRCQTEPGHRNIRRQAAEHKILRKRADQSFSFLLSPGFTFCFLNFLSSSFSFCSRACRIFCAWVLLISFRCGCFFCFLLFFCCSLFCWP